MVAGADRAELADGLLPVGLHVALAPGVAIVEQRVLDLLDVLRGRCRTRSPWRRREMIVGTVFADVVEAHVEPRGHVAAADVEADAGDA